MTDRLPVLAVVLATRGGERLDRALASVAWAQERAVLDPARGVAPGTLPPGVVLGHDGQALAALGAAPWILLLAEDEVATPGLETAVAGIVSGPAVAWRVGLELDVLGVRLTARPSPVRLGARADARLATQGPRALGLMAPRVAAGALDGGVRADRGASVAELFATLEPETRTWTALLAQSDVRPGPGSLASAPLRALVDAVRSRTAGRAGLARWVVAVFAAYRVVLMHARLWEWRHAQPAPVREVG